MEDMEEGFEVYVRGLTPREERPALTVLKRGAVSFNQAAFGALGEPEAVQLLYSAGEKSIGLRATILEHRSAHRVRQQGSTRSYLVAAKDFLRHYGVPFEVSRRYLGKLHGNMLIFDLKQAPIGMGRSDSPDPQMSNGQPRTRAGRSSKSSGLTRPPR